MRMQLDGDHDYGLGTSKGVNGIATSKASSPSRKRHGKQRQAGEWPGAVAALINTVLEDGELEEALATIVQNSGGSHQPSADIILQLVALCLEPEACLQDTSNNPEHDALHDDPYALVSHHASLRSLGTLRRCIHQPGPTRLLATLPRRAEPAGAPERAICSFSEDPEDDMGVLQNIARRIYLSEDVWQILTKRLGAGIRILDDAADSEESQIATESFVERSWNLLRLLVEAWEVEAASHEIADQDTEGIPSRSSVGLLSQFKHPAIGSLPTDLRDCLAIIFRPFERQHLDHIYRDDHVETAFRLLALLATLVKENRIDKTAFERSFCEALNTLQLPQFQEFVSWCLSDHLEVKVDLLNAYLTQHAAPATLSLPGLSPVSPAKPKAPKPPPSEIISIHSGSDSDDSDVVCLTPSTSQVSVKATPVKARPSAGSSPAKPGLSRMPPSSQDIKPNIQALTDPKLAKPTDTITRLSKLIPRELARLAVDAPKYRVPKRQAESGQGPDAKGITISMKNAEIKFATVKLELCRLYIAHAERQQAGDIRQAWQACRPDPLLSKGLRSVRAIFTSDEGKLPPELLAWEERENIISAALL